MSYTPYNSTGYLDSIEVQLVSLKARLACVKKLYLDFKVGVTAMTMEENLLEAQISALEVEFVRVHEEME